MNLNKGISTPIAILLIVAIAAVAGIAVWQFRPKEEPAPKSAADYTTQSVCENAGYYWYSNACHKEDKTEAGKVGINEARKAVASDLSRASLSIPEWEEAEVSSEEPLIFYDLKNRPVCYMFIITVNGEYDGYMTISAHTNLFPVIEYSTGELPTAKIDEALAKAKRNLSSVDPEHQLLYLPSGLADPDPYLAKFNSEKEDSDYVVIGLSSLWMKDEQELSTRQKNVDSMLSSQNPKAEATWDEITEGD